MNVRKLISSSASGRFCLARTAPEGSVWLVMMLSFLNARPGEIRCGGLDAGGSVASARANSPDIRPLDITAMRSAFPKASLIRGREHDAKSVVRQPRMTRKISAFAPTSTPRNGSSSRMKWGSVSKPLPITTFCIPAAQRRHLHFRRRDLDGHPLDHLARLGALARLADSEQPGKRRRLASVRFARTDMVCTSPSRCRSSGTSVSP